MRLFFYDIWCIPSETCVEKAKAASIIKILVNLYAIIAHELYNYIMLGKFSNSDQYKLLTISILQLETSVEVCGYAWALTETSSAADLSLFFGGSWVFCTATLFGTKIMKMFLSRKFFVSSIPSCTSTKCGLVIKFKQVIRNVSNDHTK